MSNCHRFRLLATTLLFAASIVHAADTPTVTTLKPGTGLSPTASDTVTVHYRGTLSSGQEFDSSYKRGQPVSFPLNRVIPCWTQAMQTLKVGAKAKIKCPSSTAYGERGVPGVIPPNADLFFEVELLSIGR